MSHPIVHIELSANAHQDAAKFYKEVFDWETFEYPEMDYTTANFGNKEVGVGFNNIANGHPQGATIVYIHTDDLDRSVEKIKTNGGTIINEAMEIPTVGTMVHFTDPSGNMMALLKPEMPAE